ncbi:MAG: hypothetical protein CO113_18245 [Elusimicrobia bacterium CG_4_9_14_3_um_filter_62_55]|nr:MAG: hypothetical protein COR54_04260 [Elusimicrobia bacterium CG22_combo_CG10-13_8_21_14_all_63_91]PJB23382.1 MAG: hypothetical protein CO113_18245 [Elusimicrobia bacterium CG_4_9_14_3_um_filter_62_55]
MTKCRPDAGSETDPELNGGGTGLPQLVNQINVGERITETDALGHSQIYETLGKSGLRRITKVTNAAGNSQAFEYDADINLKSQTDELGRKTAFSYDDKGNVTAVVDPLGNVTQIEYGTLSQVTAFTDPRWNRTTVTLDAKGNAVEVRDPLNNAVQARNLSDGRVAAAKDPLGRETSFTYDGRGELATVTDALGRTVTLERDALSRVRKQIGPEGQVASFEYDNQGNVTKVIDAMMGVTAMTYIPGREGRLLERVVDARHEGTAIGTTFGYDEIGRPTSVTNAVGKTLTVQYDLKSRPTTITTRRGHSISITYDALDRPIKITAPEGDTTFVYDAVGDVTRMAKYDGSSVDLVYDALDRVTQATQKLPGGFTATLSYTFDANGNRTSMSTPWGSFSYTYDVLDRVTSISNPFGQIIQFQYDALGRRTQMSYPNGTKTNYSYDPVGQIAQIVHMKTGEQTAFAFKNYDYDPSGNPTAITDTAGAHTFTYDDLDRLETANHPPAAGLPRNSESFTHDKVGNRLSDAVRTGYAYDDANRIQSDSAYTYTSDDDGNVTSKTDRTTGERTTFVYDSGNRLIRVEASTYTIASYQYGLTGDRVEKIVGGATTRFVYDGRRVLAILDASNNLLALFTNGPGTDEPLIMRRGGNDYFYHQDALGNVKALTDSQGQIVETVQYQAYGRAVVKDAMGNMHAASTVGNPFLFASRELDAETGLYYMRQRYYDAEIGRFYSEDPVIAVKFVRVLSKQSGSLHRPPWS